VRTIVVNMVEKSFNIPEEYQHGNLTIRTPYMVKCYRGDSCGMYMRQPGKEKPYVDDGFIELRLKDKRELFMAVDDTGKQVFWRDTDVRTVKS
jgi:hypothetical protein